MFETLKELVHVSTILDTNLASVQPGDYVSVDFYHESYDCYDHKMRTHSGSVFAKVILLKRPKNNLFQYYYGNVLVELPDGTHVDLLNDYNPNNSRSFVGHSSKIEQYYEKFCFPERYQNGSFTNVYTAERRAELKEAMAAEQERRKRRQEEIRLEKEAKRQRLMADRQRADEEARRNASITDRELDNLFRGR